ncbi:hypothetical protein CKO41_09340 [Thiococcus pfennigii]|nr:hypothetical protein [Thiococcus pfennigii]
MTRVRPRGFTLIELMITVAIVGILAAIAYPSYQEQIRKARRADAQAALLELAQFMERYYTMNNTYAGADDEGTLPFEKAPKDGDATYYTIDFEGVPDGTSYTLVATPAGAMTGDKCGTLSINAAGVKGISAEDVDLSVCWRQ